MVGKISELTQLTAANSAELDEIEIRDVSGTPNDDSQNMAMERRAFLSERLTTIENVTLPDGCGLVIPGIYTIGSGFVFTIGSGSILRVI